MGVPRRGLAAAGHAGQVYAVGGWSGEGYERSLEVCCAAALPPCPRFCKASARVAVGITFSSGCCQRTRVLSSPPYNRFTPAPQPLYTRPSTALHPSLNRFTPVQVFDVYRDRWAPGPPMETARCFAGAAFARGRLWVAGGYHGTANLSSVEAFDPSARRWERAPPMREARRGLGLAAVCDRLLVAVGGACLTCLPPPARPPCCLDAVVAAVVEEHASPRCLRENRTTCMPPLFQRKERGCMSAAGLPR
jgi:hypothetical protein